MAEIQSKKEEEKEGAKKEGGGEDFDDQVEYRVASPGSPSLKEKMIDDALEKEIEIDRKSVV